MKIITYMFIIIIKIYKLFISPFLNPSCRYLPTCSEYFMDCLKIHGPFKGFILGFKRIGKCHPIKILGGSSGLDMVPKKQLARKKS